MPEAEKKRILLIAANPSDTDPISLTKEFRDIKESIQATGNRNSYQIEQVEAARYKDLRRELMRFEPHIAHFCGHGEPEGILLENEQGRSEIAACERIAQLFKQCSKHTECVIFNACNSTPTAKNTQEYIDYSIGMNAPIQDKAALEFALGFYDAIGYGKNYSDAFEIGVNSIHTQPLSDKDSALIPELFQNTKPTPKTNQDKAALEFALGFYDAIGYGKNYSDAFEIGVNSIHTQPLSDKDSALIPELFQNTKPTPKTNNVKARIVNLPHTSGKLIGRQKELDLLNAAWANPDKHILVFQALGGTGKTSLLNTWLNQLEANHYQNIDKVFGWSFYSQGAAEDKQADATPFFDAALDWFGYSGDPITSDHDKGIKLAELINQQKNLLILDGLEPLQHPVGVMRGVLKDNGLKALLTQLAAHNQGLCVISSRQVVVEINDKPLVITHVLEQLQTADGITLLKSKGIDGSEKDLETAVKEVKGHALALNLLGSYLSTVYHGDIRQRDKIPALSDDLEEGKHAEKVMAAYEQHLEDQPELIILYWLGLFDRPASQQALAILRQADFKDFDKLLSDEVTWRFSIKHLEDQQLVNQLENPEHSDTTTQDSQTLDTHPLIREYFAKRFKSQYPNAWQQAHQALYEYYKDIPDKEEPNSADEMNHLFAAVAHGCAAGLHQETEIDVYWNRIQRENEFYLTKKLGAFSTDLAILSHFFDKPWQIPAKGLIDPVKAVVLNWSAFGLRALGRLEEAVEPFQAGLDISIEQEDWKGAASNASSLSELQLTRGDIPKAKAAAQQGVELADRSKVWSQEMMRRTTLADIYIQAGDWTESQKYFEKAEALQTEGQPRYPKLYSLWGFRYCDLLLATGQWQEVLQRASQTLKWVSSAKIDILSPSLDKLSLGRASLQAVYLECLKALSDSTINITQWQTLTMPPEAMVITQNDLSKTFAANQQINESQQTAIKWLNKAVEGLHKSGREDYVPLGLLARANYARFATLLDDSNTEQALQDLQETHEIAQRGGMKLHLTDYHLEATRLALTINQDIHDQTDQQHLNQAKTLIQQTHYHRRDGEVTYLEGLARVARMQRSEMRGTTTSAWNIPCIP